MSLWICSQTAHVEENGVEVTPVDRGSDRGRRVKGGRGERNAHQTLSVQHLVKTILTFVWMLYRIWRSRQRQSTSRKPVLSPGHGV